MVGRKKSLQCTASPELCTIVMKDDGREDKDVVVVREGMKMSSRRTEREHRRRRQQRQRSTMMINSRVLLIFYFSSLLFLFWDKPLLPLLHAFSFSSTTSTSSRFSSSSSLLLRASILDSTTTTTTTGSNKASSNSKKKTTTKAAEGVAATASKTTTTTTTSATVNGVTASVTTTPTTSSSSSSPSSTTTVNKANGKNGKQASSSSSASASAYTVNAKLEDIINNNGSSNSDPTGRRRKPPSSSSSSSSSPSVTDVNDFDIDDQINGKVGDWENLYGNWVLRPSSSSSSSSSSNGSPSDPDGEEPPRALLHVLGGALVGAAPHITYRYVLERLADEGFLIVATPYKLSFNHLQTCDEVLTKFENVAPMIAREYGALPVVGIGHSCGALLQLLITCLFPDTPRAANALLSFNNKPVTEAVPFFEEIFAPAFTSLATPPPRPAGSSSSSSPSQQPTRQPPLPTSNDSVKVGLKLARAATKGELPSDELLTEAVRCVGANAIPPFMKTLLPPFPFGGGGGGVGGLGGGIGGSNKHKQQEDNNAENTIQVPQQVRDAFKTWATPSVTALSESGVLPLFHQTVVSLEQIPMLVDEVAEGARDFNPTPALVRAAAGKAYRARRTLVLGYDDDSIDESDEVEEVLREARSITRMRRPMVPIDVERDTLQGGHVTPLTAPPLEVASKTEDLLGVETAWERLGYAQSEATVQRLLRWLEEGNL